MKFFKIITQMIELCIDPTRSNACKTGSDYLFADIFWIGFFTCCFYLLLTFFKFVKKWLH